MDCLEVHFIFSSTIIPAADIDIRLINLLDPIGNQPEIRALFLESFVRVVMVLVV